MDLTKLKEELDAFDDWNDEAYEDERGDIEYDNFDDHEVEDGYGRDEFIDGSDDIDEETAMDKFMTDDTSIDEWWSRLSSGDIQDDDESDSFLTANESIESLNAKEAKLREALKEIRDAKAKLTK